MGDTRPTVGYLLISPEWGPMSYSPTEGRCYKPADDATAYSFATERDALDALEATEAASRAGGWGWNMNQWQILRCVRSRVTHRQAGEGPRDGE